MATTQTATVIALPQLDKAAAKREAARLRKAKSRAKQRGDGNAPPPKSVGDGNTPAPKSVAVTPSPVTPVTPAKVSRPVTPVTRPVTLSRVCVPQLLLAGTAFALAGVGVVMNGYYAHSLGSSQTAAWVFTGVGVGADAIALLIPHTAASLWSASQRLRSVAAWVIFALVLGYTFYAGIGFASKEVADVTAVRAAAVTPQVTAAQEALRDAQKARDAECKGGQGKYCRERTTVVEQRQAALDAAQAKVEMRADPQVENAKAIVAWVTFGWLKPTANDFAILRLVLISLLPQIGGFLLMFARSK